METHGSEHLVHVMHRLNKAIFERDGKAFAKTLAEAVRLSGIKFDEEGVAVIREMATTLRTQPYPPTGG